MSKRQEGISVVEKSGTNRLGKNGQRKKRCLYERGHYRKTKRIYPGRKRKSFQEGVSKSAADMFDLEKSCAASFDQGFKNGMKKGWDLVWKIGNLPCRDMEEIFGLPSDQIRTVDPEDADDIVDHYIQDEEYKKIMKMKKFEVGDQVKNNDDEVYIVTYVDDEVMEGISKDGHIHFNYLEEVEKTGSRFDTLNLKHWLAHAGELT